MLVEGMSQCRMNASWPLLCNAQLQEEVSVWQTLRQDVNPCRRVVPCLTDDVCKMHGMLLALSGHPISAR